MDTSLFGTPERFFNTAGPVNSDKHYCLPALERFDLNEVVSLIQKERYFILHAPRSNGEKQTYLKALATYLNESGYYHCLYVNVEAGQAARGNMDKGIQAILSIVGKSALYDVDDPYPASIWQDTLRDEGALNAFAVVLGEWSRHTPKPIVLFIDEIDALIGDTLISVLRQLRSGYDKRPEGFPQSIILCGVRDVRDYRIFSDEQQAMVLGGSAFNIKAKSLRLGNFTQQDIATLYQQHTDTTGQPFAPGVIEMVWELTQGQPWLVNALAYEACFEQPAGKERTTPITTEIMHAAKEQLILRRDTHLDQLAHKLIEERVKRVLLPILATEHVPEETIPPDDIQYAQDLGLIHLDKPLRIANAMYREIIPRELIYSTEYTMVQEAAWYIVPDGRLDMPKLLTAFQAFFREHSEHWVE
ncbi:MAG: ATP-binding protein, partial [Chloroflexaceae bacterium]|nr:ATP-binding protein [Chloroflexaceae bacterium]